jgi:hypothetical protein
MNICKMAESVWKSDSDNKVKNADATHRDATLQK